MCPIPNFRPLIGENIKIFFLFKQNVLTVNIRKKMLFNQLMVNIWIRGKNKFCMVKTTSKMFLCLNDYTCTPEKIARIKLFQRLHSIITHIMCQTSLDKQSISYNIFDKHISCRNLYQIFISYIKIILN